MATILTNIGTRSAENIDMTSVSGAGPYTVTVASVPSETKVGDILNDEAASPNTYLITGISGTDLTVTDSFGAAASPDASGTSQATTERAYAGATTALGLWAADHDDTDLYANGDDAQGECYNDGGTAFDESVTIDGGGTVGLNSVTLTVPESERHDGTAGTGARIVVSTGPGLSGIIALDPPDNTTPFTVEWLEISGGKNSDNSNARGFSIDNPPGIVQNTILHGVYSDGSSSFTIGIKRNHNTFPGSNQDIVQNSIIYDIDGSGGLTTGEDTFGIETTTARNLSLLNNTIHDIFTESDSDPSEGISVPDASAITVQNNVATDAVNNGSGGFASFDPSAPSNATVSHNASSDATASGTGSLTNITTADQYESTSPVDLHLKTGSDCIDAGTDLGTTPTGVNIDIDGRDRDAEGDTWDIGADEFVAAASAAIAGHPIMRGAHLGMRLGMGH